MRVSESFCLEIASLDAVELARRIAACQLSSAEVIEAHIRRIEEVDGRLAAVPIRLFEDARREAEAADAAIAAGKPLGPLHGVPVTLKECFHVRGTDSTIGVEHLVGDQPSSDGPLAARLKSAGAIILGKTNIAHLMMMYESDNPLYGRTNNPWDLERSPGGSSGGEAAIIAAGGSPLGLGSDIGGSIRQPAHSCGICGLKPTSGRLPIVGGRDNVEGMEAIRFQPGPMARTVQDLNVAMRVLVDARDSCPDAGTPPVPWRDPTAVRLNGLRIGMWTDDGYFSASPAIRRAVDEAAVGLEERGAIVEPFEPPDVSGLMSVYMGLLFADGMANLRRLSGRSRNDWRMRRLMALGRIPYLMRKPLASLLTAIGQPYAGELMGGIRKQSALGYWKLTAALNGHVRRFIDQFQSQRLDAMIMPPHALPALTHGGGYYVPVAGSYCFWANALGLPAGVVPATRVRAGEETDRVAGRDVVLRAAVQVERGSVGLPVGVQVAALHWCEDIVLAVMQALELHFRGKPDFPRTPVDVAGGNSQ